MMESRVMDSDSPCAASIETVDGMMPRREITSSNRLPELAARIKSEHQATASALKRSVQHAMAAGDLLIEAKALVKHGQWLSWLSENCAMSERTAQLYMRVAKQRAVIESNTQQVADLTLNETAALLMLSSDVRKLLAFAKTIQGMSGDELAAFCISNDVALINDPSYDPNRGKTDEQVLEWQIFMLFLARRCGWHPQSASAHVEWLLQRPFISVADWLNADGWRKAQCMEEISPNTKDSWLTFLESNHGRSLNDVVADLESIEERIGPAKPVPAIAKTRSRRAA